MQKEMRALSTIVICSAFLASGCATTHRQYSGKSRSSTDVATITIRNSPISTSKLNGEEVKVDKQRTLKQSCLWGLCPPMGVWAFVHYITSSTRLEIVEVLPGKQELEVNYSSRAGNIIVYSKYPKLLLFDARPGCAYRVNGGSEGNTWSAYVEDITDPKSNVVCSVTKENDRSGFQKALQKAMSDGAISTDEITVTYPDGSTYRMKAK